MILGKCLESGKVEGIDVDEVLDILLTILNESESSVTAVGNTFEIKDMEGNDFFVSFKVTKDEKEL
jgi:hypothetical protein